MPAARLQHRLGPTLPSHNPTTSQSRRTAGTPQPTDLAPEEQELPTRRNGGKDAPGRPGEAGEEEVKL